MKLFVVVAVLTAFSWPAFAQSTGDEFPVTPDGFDRRREGIEHGKLETVTYSSSAVGIERQARVYTPAGYSRDQKYPTLYLLHGAGSDENEWVRGGFADAVLDNLIADKKATPMIVVMPNGRASRNVTARDPFPDQIAAFAAFEQDLLNDLIPFIERTYSAQADRESRALAGVSLGGGQALNFGLGHLETFAWVGGFAPANNTRPIEELVPDPEKSSQMLKLLYLSCGDQDGLFSFSQSMNRQLNAINVSHLYNVIPYGKHNFRAWRGDLYYFSQRLFSERK